MKKSLGNLSALAALCATGGSANAVVVVSSGIHNEVIVSPTTVPSEEYRVSFDVDGDGQDDIGFYTNSANMYVEQAGTTPSFYVLTAPSSGQVRRFGLGEVVDGSLPNATFDIVHGILAPEDSLWQEGMVYMGFVFEAATGDLHAGFATLEVSLDASDGEFFDKSGDSVVLVSASWETVSNAAITVVPEPSTFLCTLSGLAGLALLRRRRS